jgi:hypothetical protein
MDVLAVVLAVLAVLVLGVFFLFSAVFLFSLSSLSLSLSLSLIDICFLSTFRGAMSSRWRRVVVVGAGGRAGRDDVV